MTRREDEIENRDTKMETEIEMLRETQRHKEAERHRERERGDTERVRDTETEPEETEVKKWGREQERHGKAETEIKTAQTQRFLEQERLREDS